MARAAAHRTAIRFCSEACKSLRPRVALCCRWRVVWRHCCNRTLQTCPRAMLRFDCIKSWHKWPTALNPSCEITHDSSSTGGSEPRLTDRVVDRSRFLATYTASDSLPISQAGAIPALGHWAAANVSVIRAARVPGISNTRGQRSPIPGRRHGSGPRRARWRPPDYAHAQ